MIPQEIIQKANEYVEKEYPFVWPVNKHGEEIVMRVGQKAPPFSRKHAKQQKKCVNSFIAGYSLAAEEISKRDEQIKELVQAMQLAVSQLSTIADCTNGIAREMAEMCAESISKLLTKHKPNDQH